MIGSLMFSYLITEKITSIFLNTFERFIYWAMCQYDFLISTFTFSMKSGSWTRVFLSLVNDASVVQLPPREAEYSIIGAHFHWYLVI